MRKQTVAYDAWFSEYDFEAMISVRVGHSLDKDGVPKLLHKEVVEPLQRFLKADVAGIYVFFHGQYTFKAGLRVWKAPHVHMLVATSRRNLNANIEPAVSFLLRKPKALLLTHPNSIDIMPYIPNALPQYVAKHLVDDSYFDFINPKLLSKIRSQK